MKQNNRSQKQNVKTMTDRLSQRPKRIQRKRVKGWKMPAGAVYVGRPTKWGGNPYRVGQASPMHSFSMSAEEAVRCYRQWLLANQQSSLRFRLSLDELRGKDLACWCPLDKPCHADVLLEIANRGNL